MKVELIPIALRCIARTEPDGEEIEVEIPIKGVLSFKFASKILNEISEDLSVMPRFRDPDTLVSPLKVIFDAKHKLEQKKKLC